MSISYMFRTTPAERQTFEKRIILAYLPTVIHHEADICTISNNFELKTSVPRAVKLDLSHKAFDIILGPSCESCFFGFSRENGKGLTKRCHPLLVKMAAVLL